jgi:dihydrolipoamide dehydrogenase
MNAVRHDLVVLGGGPAGYVAAIRAAQLGMNVACIDENSRFGGTCLRVGCIPSKSLLESSHLYEEAKHRFVEHGLKMTGLEIDLNAMMRRKDKIVDTLTGGIDMLFKKRGVTAYRGRGKFRDAHSIEIASADFSSASVAALRLCHSSKKMVIASEIVRLRCRFPTSPSVWSSLEAATSDWS